jgi:hypothetical protein
VLNTLIEHNFQDAFKKWQKHWERWIHKKGDYLHGDGGQQGPCLWPSGQESWEEIQIFWEVVCMVWSSLNLMRITEELLEWKSSGSSPENRD